MVESVSVSSGVVFRVNTHLSSPNMESGMLLFCPLTHRPRLLGLYPTTCRECEEWAAAENDQELLFMHLQEETEKITFVIRSNVDAILDFPIRES